jgi:hypothetical protein
MFAMARIAHPNGIQHDIEARETVDDTAKWPARILEEPWILKIPAR